MSDFVVHGSKIYIDHDRTWGDQRQWLVSDTSANILSNFLAVFLSLAVQRGVFAILKRTVLVAMTDRDATEVATPPNTEEPEADGVQEDLRSIVSVDDVSVAERESISLDNLARTSSSQIENVPDSNNDQIAPVTTHQSGGLNNADTREGADPHSTAHSLDHAEPENLRNIIEESHSPEGLLIRALLLFSARVVPGAVHLGTNLSGPWSRISKLQFWTDAWRNFKDEAAVSTDLIQTLGIALLMAVIYFGSIILSVYSALVISTGVAISAHPGCHRYGTATPEDGNPALSRGQKYFQDIEKNGADYARQCYGAPTGADGCHYFYQQSIPYQTFENVSCPFTDRTGDLCYSGSSSAFQLKTGKILPQAIGINTPNKFTFERETICSPLLMDGGRIRRGHDESLPFRMYYEYFYGASTDVYGNCSEGSTDCTCKVASSLDQAYKVYSTNAPLMISDNPKPRWVPIWNMSSYADWTPSLILISNVGIAYPNERTDPIFPADKTYDNGTWFFSERWHAGVIGCIDRTIICSPDGSVCGDLRYWLVEYNNFTSVDTEDYKVVVMLTIALMFSDMHGAIGYRLAAGLDAQTRTMGYHSLQLPSEQWKIEIRNFFNTSLARVQITARDFARGPPDGDTDGLISMMRPEYEPLCNMYKFNATGWRNISVGGYVGAIVAGLMVVVFSLPVKGNKLWVETVPKKLSDCGRILFQLVKDGSKSMVDGIRDNAARLYGSCLAMFRKMFRRLGM